MLKCSARIRIPGEVPDHFVLQFVGRLYSRKRHPIHFLLFFGGAAMERQMPTETEVLECSPTLEWQSRAAPPKTKRNNSLGSHGYKQSTLASQRLRTR